LCLLMIRMNEGWSTKLLSSGDYDSDIFIPLFRDDHSGYYVLPVKAPSFRAAGLKPDITLQRRPLRLMAPSSTLPLTMTLARSLQPLHSLRPPPRCLRRPASVAFSEYMRSLVTSTSSASSSSSVTVK
jgi:hypothetical protein